MRQAAVTDSLDPSYLANVLRLRRESFFVDALRRAEHSCELRAALGEPLEAELPTGGVHDLFKGSDVQQRIATDLLSRTQAAFGLPPVAPPEVERFAHVAVVLRGPNGQGKLIVFAVGDAEEWLTISLAVTVEGREDRVDLLSEGQPD